MVIWALHSPSLIHLGSISSDGTICAPITFFADYVACSSIHFSQLTFVSMTDEAHFPNGPIFHLTWLSVCVYFFRMPSYMNELHLSPIRICVTIHNVSIAVYIEVGIYWHHKYKRKLIHQLRVVDLEFTSNLITNVLSPVLSCRSGVGFEWNLMLILRKPFHFN